MFRQPPDSTAAGPVAFAVLVTAVVGLGCNTLKPDVPDERMRDILSAARTRDTSAVPRLVEELDHDDLGVRYCAILSLEKITGTRLGYQADAPAPERRAAIRAWRAYVDEHAETHPAAGGSSARAARTSATTSTAQKTAQPGPTP